MINEVIDLINDGLNGIHAQQIVLGLAQRVYRVTSSGVEYMPGIVKMDGEAIYAGVDDVNSLMIYHKANTANLSYTPRGGYGDQRINEDTFAFSLVALWDTRKMPIQAVDMLLLLRTRMPQQIVGLKDIKHVLIVPSTANLNTRQIFDAEYIFDKDYLLPMFINMIQINYAIQIKYDQQCIEKCINCSN